MPRRVFFLAAAVALVQCTVYFVDVYASMSWSASRVSCSPELDHRPRVIPPIKRRYDLGALLENEGMKTGVELGVFKGEFATQILSQWTHAEHYVLVDLWRPLENYKDLVNRQSLETMEFYMSRAINRTLAATAKAKIQVCRNFTVQCARLFPNEYFDFVYVDARHDYAGVKDDLSAWWPKLRRGGIMAGHDFVEQHEGPRQMGQDWSLNWDGTKGDGSAVRGAVTDFFNSIDSPDRYRQILVSYLEGMPLRKMISEKYTWERHAVENHLWMWWSWVVRK